MVGVPNRFFAIVAPPPVGGIGEQNGGGMSQSSSQVGYCGVHGDHPVGGQRGLSRVEKILELASSVGDVRKAFGGIARGVVVRSQGLKVLAELVELLVNISAHLQADPVDIARRQEAGEFQDR